MIFYTFCQENLPRTMPFQYCRVRSLNPHKYLKIKMYELSSSLPVMRCSRIHHTLLVYVSSSFFDVISRERIRMEKFSVVSKIYTKNGSKIDNFYFFLNINSYFFFEILCSCKIIASFL